MNLNCSLESPISIGEDALTYEDNRMRNNEMEYDSQNDDCSNLEDTESGKVRMMDQTQTQEGSEYHPFKADGENEVTVMQSK